MTVQSITRNELLVLHNELGAKARELMTLKNHDYAVEADVFRNFRAFGTLGVLVRLSDKLARLRSFEENGEFKVTDEKLLDTILDIINYAVIYFAMKQETDGTDFPFGANVIEMKKTVQSGPFCDFCVELADFAADDNSKFVCSNCAVEYGFDTTTMAVLEQVA